MSQKRRENLKMKVQQLKMTNNMKKKNSSHPKTVKKRSLKKAQSGK